MAVRPVYVPRDDDNGLVWEYMVEFKWHPGMSISQARKNVDELHASASAKGLVPLLEISTKGNLPLGRRLSAFNLKLDVKGLKIPIENIFQASKIFENGGPYLDLLEAKPRDAKTDARLRNSGKMIAFRFLNEEFPIEPKTIFYDYLYILTLKDHKTFLSECLGDCVGFTDIVFNPEKSLNCQARSCALFLSLCRKGILEETISSFSSFRENLSRYEAYFVDHSGPKGRSSGPSASWEEFLQKKRRAAKPHIPISKQQPVKSSIFDNGHAPKNG